MEEGEEVEDGRGEGSSTTGDGGQAAVSLTADGMHICTFESSQLEGMCVGDLLYFVYLSFVFEESSCSFCNMILP